MTRAIAASESEITEVRAPVLLNSCSLCLNPPSRMDSPRTSRILPMMDPVIEAFITLVSPLESAMAAMISSAALPKVAFKSPPSPSPTRAASSSVARPIQPATGMIAMAEQTKSAVGLPWPGQKRSANAIGAKIRSQFRDGFILINTAEASGLLDNPYQRLLSKFGCLPSSRFEGQHLRSGGCCTGIIIAAISRDDYVPNPWRLEIAHVLFIDIVILLI